MKFGRQRLLAGQRRQQGQIVSGRPARRRGVDIQLQARFGGKIQARSRSAFVYLSAYGGVVSVLGTGSGLQHPLDGGLAGPTGNPLLHIVTLGYRVLHPERCRYVADR